MAQGMAQPARLDINYPQPQKPDNVWQFLNFICKLKQWNKKSLIYLYKIFNIG